MNVTIKQLRAFVAVAESQSFAEACDSVHLSQPALSITIKNLEDSVGGRLLARSTRTLALTPEGEAFYPVAQRLLNDWDGALADLHNLFSMRRGKLSIAAMPSFASNQLSHALAVFRQNYPDVNVSIEDVVAESVVDMVRSGRVEIGITFEPAEIHGLDFFTLFSDKFVAVIPPQHHLANCQTITWNMLQGVSFIALQRPSSIRQLIEKELETSGYGLSVELEAHHLGTVGRMVAAGLGISAVPALCMDQMEEMGAVCKPLSEPEISRRVGVITRLRYPLSAAGSAMQAVLQTLFDKQKK